VRIHRLTTGRVRGPRRPRGALRYVRLEWSEEALPVNAFLIEHPQGMCLVDAGQSAFAAKPGYLSRWHPFLRIARFELEPEDEVGAQLRRLGVQPEEVRWVVLTHLHTDHVGGLADLSASDVVVSETEWERARGLRGRVRGYVPQHWPPEIAPRFARLTGPAFGPFAASCDLVDDGSIRLVPLPGHTPGQIGVLVRADSGAALIGGDAAHTWHELEATDPKIAAYCRREGIQFLAAHDDELPLLIELSANENVGQRPERGAGSEVAR
jgi:N-acyl homoserine lactone hydrolase